MYRYIYLSLSTSNMYVAHRGQERTLGSLEQESQAVRSPENQMESMGRAAAMLTAGPVP